MSPAYTPKTGDPVNFIQLLRDMSTRWRNYCDNGGNREIDVVYRWAADELANLVAQCGHEQTPTELRLQTRIDALERENAALRGDDRPTGLVHKVLFDQVYKELEQYRQWHRNGRTNIEFIETDVIHICKGEHDKHEPCEWTTYRIVPEADPAKLLRARPRSEWHEDDGPALWWSFPIQEPPYVGRGNDEDCWSYYTHWSPIPIPTVQSP